MDCRLLRCSVIKKLPCASGHIHRCQSESHPQYAVAKLVNTKSVWVVTNAECLQHWLSSYRNKSHERDAVNTTMIIMTTVYKFRRRVITFTRYLNIKEVQFLQRLKNSQQFLN